MNNIVWIIVFGLIAVGAILYARSLSEEKVAASRTMGFPQTVGAGIVGLGILLLVMPWAASATAAFDFVASSEFSVLTGAAFVIGIITILAGVVLVAYKESSADS